MAESEYSMDAWLSWGEINTITESRKLVFFGRGEWMEKSIPYLAKSAEYVVDNNKYEQGQEESGLEIKGPECLKNAKGHDEIFIIITTSGFMEVDRQLRGYGLHPGTHYCVSPSLKNFHVVSRINGHHQLVHFTCSDQPDKSNPEKGGGLYSYDIATRQKKKLISGLCHGLVQCDDKVFLVDDIVGIRVMNRDLETIKILDLPPKSRPHGIAYCAKRNIIFVNFSGRDAVGMYNVESEKFLGEISISDKFKKSGLAQHHINDCCVYGDYLYVSMFSFSGNWKIGVYDGGILQFDLNTQLCLGPAVTDLWMPHTPVVINGMLHYCDSMRGIVSNSTWRKMAQFNGFVRGIACDSTFLYIGQSTHRYIDRREGTTSNISLDTGIFLVEPRQHITKFYSTPELSDINSVAIIN
ncbi:MAG: TIGR03032 family protein [Gammaproteobacteria bacterium]|nr:TIGR03032 family protein [Gammaproteobacteria bacterium]